MARINIEIEKLLKDSRFIDLILKLGSRRSAFGEVVLAYALAQKYWMIGRCPIPTEVYERERLSTELIEVGLAEKVQNGEAIYIKGSDEQFAWLIQRSNAGKSSAKRKAEIIEELRQRPLRVVQPLSLSLSLNSKKEEEEKKPTSSELHQLMKIWNSNSKLPQVRGSSKTTLRWKSSITRLKDTPPDVDPRSYWAGVVDKIAQSSFCAGKNDRGWKATYDWFIKPDTHFRVMEGKYDDFKNTQKISVRLEDFSEQDKIKKQQLEAVNAKSNN